MTAPPPAAQPAPFDTSNPLLGEQPSQLMTALAATPAGQRLSLTIRTPSTTLTVFLAGPDARAWAAQLTKDSASMSVAGLVVANGTTLPGRPLGSERDRDAGRLLLLPGGMPVGGRVQRREHLHRPRGCGSRCV